MSELPIRDPAPQNRSVPSIKLSREEFDRSYDIFQKSTGSGRDPLSGFSQFVVDEVAQEYDDPEFLSYQGLKDGTSPFFDQFDLFKDRDPSQRRLSDEQILSLFVTDLEGNPIEEGSFLEGVKRGTPGGIFSTAGMYAGAKTANRLASGLPPVGPFSAAARILAPLTGGLIGGVAGGSLGEYVSEEIFGEESPILPGTSAAFEAGKMTPYAVAAIPFPFALGRAGGVDLGGKVGAIVTNIQNGAPSLSSRAVRGTERFIQRIGDQARKAPVTTGLIESGAAAGTVGGTYLAEDFVPDFTPTRIATEIAFGLLGGTATAAGIKYAPMAFSNAWKGIKGLYKGGVAGALQGVSRRGETQAVNFILDRIEEFGEDPEQIIEALLSKEFDDLLVDPKTGDKIKLDAGTKSGSLALLSLSRQYRQTAEGAGLADEGLNESQKAIERI